MTSPKVEIIVVKYNQPDFEAQTLERVATNTTYPNYSLRAHQNEKGTALSVCWNRLIEQSDAEYICLLNNDTVVTPHWLTNLMKVFTEVPSAGAVVPTSNRVFLSQVPWELVDEYDFAEINGVARKQAKDQTCVQLPTASGMCVLFPKALWAEAGKFDEEFFLYGEDTEFFYRLAERTGKILVWYKGVYVHHYKAQSTNKAVADGELDIAAVRKRSEELCNSKMPNFQISHN